MTYRLAEHDDPQRIRLVSRSAASIAVGVLLLLIGAALVAVGVLGPWAPTRIFDVPSPLVGVGIAFLFAGIMVALHRAPAELVFDNGAAHLLVKATSSMSEDCCARVPYDQLSGFEVHKCIEQSSRTRHVSYRIVLRKRDGARWVLTSQQSERAAQHFCEELRGCIQLHRRAEHRLDPLPSGTFQIDVGPSTTTVSWKKRVGVLSTVGTVGILMGMFVAALSLPLVGAISVGLFVGLFLVLVAYHTIRTVGKLVKVQLKADSISIEEQGGFFPKSSSIPIEDVHGVLFHFDPSVVDRNLLFLNESQMRALLSDEPPSGLMAVIQQARGMRVMDVGGLTMGEKIELEQILQREVERRSGKALA